MTGPSPDLAETRKQLRETEQQIMALRKALADCLEAPAMQPGGAAQEVEELKRYRDRIGTEPGKLLVVPLGGLREKVPGGGLPLLSYEELLRNVASLVEIGVLDITKAEAVIQEFGLLTRAEMRRIDTLIRDKEAASASSDCSTQRTALAEAEARASALNSQITTLRGAGTTLVNWGAVSSNPGTACEVGETSTSCRVTRDGRHCDFTVTYKLPGPGELAPGARVRVELKGNYKCSYDAGPPPKQLPLGGATVGLIEDERLKGFDMQTPREEKYPGWDGSYRCRVFLGHDGSAYTSESTVHHTCEIGVRDTFPNAPPYSIKVSFDPVGWVLQWVLD